MSSELIVSYDGTANDDDALALAELFAPTGAKIALAYVRHAREFDAKREELAQHDAERRLSQGVDLLGDPAVERHVLFSASTGEGLQQLAQARGASAVVFGSDYRTPPGHAEPGKSAQHLLEGGSVAVAIAAAGLRTQNGAAIRTIVISSEEGDHAAEQTAEALVTKLGAKIVGTDEGPADLIVVGSQQSAPEGRVALSGTTRSTLNIAIGSVLVVPRGTPVQF